MNFIESLNLIKSKFIKKEIITIFIVTILYLIIQILTSCRDIYGYYIDEFYYFACANRLAFGYVDHPPLSIFILFIYKSLFGESLFAIRFLASIFGAASVFLIGLIVYKLGGKIIACLFACISMIATPIFLGITNFYSMNAIEVLIWLICIYIIIIIIKDNKPKLWILFGIIFGLGLENKHTIVLLGFALIIGLLLTKERKQFANIWIWIGILLSCIIFTPNIIWEIINNWPTLEFYKNAGMNKYIQMPYIAVLLNTIFQYNPILLLVWFSGLIYLFFSKELREYRVFAIAFLILLIFLIITKSSRPDRIMGIFPILLASGSIFIEKLYSEKIILIPVKYGILFLIIISTLIMAPIALPILPPQKLAQYMTMLHVNPQMEYGNKSSIPQWFGNRLGWQEMVKETAKVYNSLTDDEKKDTTIFGAGYGNAGAVDFFGKKYGLPNAISSHNNYYLWGPGKKSNKILIAIGYPDMMDDLENIYKDVKVANIVKCEYCPQYRKETFIYLSRDPKTDLAKVWNKLKFYF